MHGLMLVGVDVCVVVFYVRTLTYIARNYYMTTVEGLILQSKFEFV